MHKQSGVSLEQTQQTWYAIKVPGRVLASTKYMSRRLAEEELQRWEPEVVALAEIVMIDAQGRELLFENSP
ncbi:MAG: hypothetical protein ACREAU_00510 [Nitrosopumilaceae archaeon]